METNRWPANASMINQDDHKGDQNRQTSPEESEIMLNSPGSSASGYIGEGTFDASSRIVCTLCYCEIPPHMIHTIKSCGCRFCVTCLRTYLILNIKENNINGLVCPDSNCVALKKPKRSISDRLWFRGSAHSKNRKQLRDSNGSVIRALTSGSNGAKFTPQEIKLLVGDEMYSLYKKYKLIMDVDEDPNRTWCPKANCDTICLITKPSVGRLPASAAFSIKLTKSAKVSLTDGRSSFYCAKCNEVYCTLCRKKWHDKPLCKSSSEAELLAPSDSRANGLDSSDVDSNIKRCPRCLVWIERDEGCAQMMCRKCKHVFCWFCLHSLEVCYYSLLLYIICITFKINSVILCLFISFFMMSLTSIIYY